MLKKLYRFHPDLLLRTPVRAFDSAFDAETLRACLREDDFMEALYLASPDLCQECRKWLSGELTDAKKQEKLLATLVRYYTRMSSRCTPFGLFAGCSVISWGAESRITLDPANNTRHTRLDMHYLCALAYQVAGLEAVKERIRYFPNSSIYQIGEEVRYIEQRFDDNRQEHQISAAAASPVLLQAIAACQGGLTRQQIAARLADDETELAPAQDYVEMLIGAQVLVSELEPTVTGQEFQGHVLQVLARLQAAAPDAGLAALHGTLQHVTEQLTALDQRAVNAPQAYEQIVDALQPLEIPIQKNRLFQTDAIRGLAPGATLDQQLQHQLLEALDVMARLTTAHQNERLDDFRRRFQARYEGQTVPLLEALDSESGVFYSDFGRNTFAPLVHDLVPAKADARPRTLRQSEVQHFLYQKLREADRNHEYSIELSAAELTDFAPPTSPLPPSLPVMFRVLAHGQVLLESASGSSAVNLLGRFAHADARIAQLITDVTRHEQDQNPGVVFAEIAHLPVSRVGNILLRPSFRDFEIPYLAQSGLPPENQLRLQDLTLAVEAGRLVVRSARTGQVIVPRLSTAHNFTHQALPVYAFLCDLQMQGLQPHLGFSWSSVSLYAKFLPRLTFRQVILQPASWQLAPADLQALLAATPATLPAALQALQSRWQLPRFFTLADGDNELLVDTENSVSVAVWLAAIRNRPLVNLREFLFAGSDGPVCDASGRPHVHQLVALLLRDTPSYPPAVPAPKPAPAAVARTFSAGSEWLYYKLYCGQKVADRVLLEIVQPLVADLLAQGIIDQWFFIRYADPDNHLRLRLHLADVQHIGAVLQLVNSCVQSYISSGYIWKMQLDTYYRELERYGTHTMALSESLFFENSQAVLAVLAAHAANPDDSAPIWVQGLRQIDELLDAFGYALPERLALLQQLKEGFSREFGLEHNKVLRLQLDAKYRGFRTLMQQVLRPSVTDSAANSALRRIASQILVIEQQGELEIALPELLGSYIHMLLNRLIPADARLHEMVLYDFLYRQYQSQRAMQKAAP